MNSRLTQVTAVSQQQELIVVEEATAATGVIGSVAAEAAGAAAVGSIVDAAATVGNSRFSSNSKVSSSWGQ
jgi:hypothetical protein